MDNALIPAAKEQLISSFLEIAVGETPETALQFLQATNWKLEEAIQLFYVGNEGRNVTTMTNSPPAASASQWDDQNYSGPGQELGKDVLGQDDNDGVRAPLPVIREALYGDAPVYGAPRTYVPHEANSVVAFRNFNEEMKRPGVWESNQAGPSTADKAQDNLAALYRPPFALMFHGAFEKAKAAASTEDKWLLVNLQSTKEFSSHLLNRDTWGNEAVAQTIKSNFIFWQVYDDTSEGKKVCTYYKVETAPTVMIIDPITGQRMRSWSGMIHPDRLLEDLFPYMDNGPQNHHISVSHKRPRENPLPSKQKTQAADMLSEEDEEMQRALAMSMESGLKDANDVAPGGKEAATSGNEIMTRSEEKKPEYPALPEEPRGDKSMLCRVGFRLPDGHRVQRNFLRSDPIQLLWSFCHSQLEDAQKRPFRLAQAIPGSAKSLDYDDKVTIHESGLSNSMISVTWE